MAHLPCGFSAASPLVPPASCVDSENPSRSPYADSGQGLSFGTFEPLSLELLHWNCARLVCGHLPNKTGTQGTEKAYCAALQLHEPACFIDFVALPKYAWVLLTIKSR